MKIAIVHNAVPPGAGPDERDVLVQVDSVTGALCALGHEPWPLPVTLDLALFARQLGRLEPALVFNLVESLDGSGRLIHVVPSLLDRMRVPFTGCPTVALFVTTDKILSKEIMRAAGLPTPGWVTAAGLAAGDPPPDLPCIVKPVGEDASVGVDERSLVTGAADLAGALAEMEASYGDAFAESYVNGREFNLSILAGPAGPEVLPPAEIVFEGYPEGKPRVVGYRAKWDEGSFEYSHTVRSFDFAGADSPLVDSLRALALRCWDLFGLRGYARVDFRADHSGAPWILEVNANPCISPDAGFVAAAGRAGLGFEGVVERIVGDLRRRLPRED
ncbi:MAG: D-alanine--D-alanine ligase [Candidatus Krumholzibacteria bacterium]|nr:D-alanine--D-alanine ligase [Candidatus Krumholzibacteria bacterium]